MFTYLTGRAKETEGEEERDRERKEIFHPLVHISNAYNNWGWPRSKPGVMNFIRFSHMIGMDSST